MKIAPLLERTLEASRQIAAVDDLTLNSLLHELAEEAVKQSALIMAENKKDLELMDSSDPKYDRLKLTEERIAALSADIRQVASLP